MKRTVLCILFSIFCWINSVFSSARPLIQSMRGVHNRIAIVASPEFKKDFLLDDFWVEYEDESIDVSQFDYALKTMPFVLAVAPVVWLSNEQWVVDEMDVDLYHALLKIRSVFKQFFQTQGWNGSFVVKKLVFHSYADSPLYAQHKNECALLFSGGLDATAASYSHLDTKQLLITHCGGDVPLNALGMWQGVKQHCQAHAQRFNFDTCFVRSNFARFLNSTYLSHKLRMGRWWALTSQSMHYTGLIAPVLITRGYPIVYIGATRTHDFPWPYGTHPAIDNALRFGGVRVVHENGNLDRVEKVAMINEVAQKQKEVLPILRVCWGKCVEGGNCGVCEKCLRTMSEICSLGLHPRSFGYTCSPKELFSRLMLFFAGEPQFTGGLVWHWRCVQKTIKKYIQEDGWEAYPEEFRTLVRYINSLNVGLYQINKKVRDRHYPPNREPFFCELWQESIREDGI